LIDNGEIGKSKYASFVKGNIFIFSIDARESHEKTDHDM